jgi:hypothetical protein
VLLYDRLMDHAYRFLRTNWERRDEEFVKRSGHAYLALKDAAVFDLNDVVPLMGDWEREKDHPIPKTPPADLVWAEWTCREEGATGWTNWHLGATVRTHTRAEIETCLPNLTMSEGGRPLNVFLDSGEEYYAVNMFKMTTGSSRPDENRLNYIPAIDMGTFIWAMKRDGSGCSCQKVSVDTTSPDKQAVRKALERISIFGLPVVASFYEDRHYQVAYPWVPFMGFALMHCKNVAVEEHVPDERTQRRAKKAGCAARCVYKTLKIEVPQAVMKRQGYESQDDDGPKVRFHLCRGHFKNLQHERFKSKGWHWWPAHWRGSKDVGEVFKTYSVKPGAC